jgi:hypothetical protein
MYNIDTINKNTGTLINASKEADLEVSAEKTKYMLVSRDQNARQNHDTKQQSDVLNMWQS